MIAPQHRPNARVVSSRACGRMREHSHTIDKGQTTPPIAQPTALAPIATLTPVRELASAVRSCHSGGYHAVTAAAGGRADVTPVGEAGVDDRQHRVVVEACVDRLRRQVGVTHPEHEVRGNESGGQPHGRQPPGRSAPRHPPTHGWPITKDRTPPARDRELRSVRGPATRPPRDGDAPKHGDQGQQQKRDRDRRKAPAAHHGGHHERRDREHAQRGQRRQAQRIETTCAQTEVDDESGHHQQHRRHKSGAKAGAQV